ncbi:hypothetical protein [Sphingomicrobium arenosum]|uniref:hypothetical protein n=1 Tax=Sphingomicrobium arenosum TaxID=2233861 RepID=UPI00223FAA1D|nr:hypothetical protein [Sphingomicrobium arenosum]
MTTDNEAGKSRTDGQWDVPPLDHSELVQMRIRLIALETIVTGLLCDISTQQRAAIEQLALTISPKDGGQRHPLTELAAADVRKFFERSDKLSGQLD